MTFSLRHLAAALLLHVALFGLLVSGVQCARKPVRPPVIQAVLLDPDRKETAQQKRADEQRRAEQRRKAEAEKKRLEAEARRKVEQEQKQREADAQKKKLAEEAQRKKAEEVQRKAAEAQRQKELAEQKKAEEQARRKQEQEEKREQQEQAQRELQEKARMEEELRKEEIRRDLEREQGARAASERERKTAEWAAVLERHVQRHWIRPGSASADFQCTVRVQLLPDGTVTTARIDRSCGNAQLDKSVEDAVYRASPVPRPADPSVFDRDLIINFIPGL